MKKVYKIYAVVKGYHGDRVYYASTPQQLEDVTYEVAGKHGYASEKAALADLEKCEESVVKRNQEFTVLPIYTQK